MKSVKEHDNENKVIKETILTYQSDGRTVVQSLPTGVTTELIHDEQFRLSSVLQMDGNISKAKLTQLDLQSRNEVIIGDQVSCKVCLTMQYLTIFTEYSILGYLRGKQR